MSTADVAITVDSPDYRARSQQILSQFAGQIEPVKVPASYRMGILAVAVVMILLPMIYLAMIAAVGWAVWYHAVHHYTILETANVRGRGMIMLLIIYIAPMVIGSFFFLFMLKPIFAGTGKAGKKQLLDESLEPLLFQFVYRVCDAVRAPRPRIIQFDTEVNASASFRRGLLSMVTGNDLALTIGTPLIAGLDTRQFAGVLAHEFGHFSQGAGMRLTYIIRTISFWLARGVYERDEWDERLVQWSKEWDIRLGWVFYVTRAFVWLTRRVLWCLMWIGNAVSGFMLRQMEFDADRNETRLAGSATFESTSRRIAVLSFANHAAQSDLEDFYRDGRLGDDVARLIDSNARRFDASTLEKIRAFVDGKTTSTFDTHPCDRDRIANAKREMTDGIFRLELPATSLLTDFNGLSRQVTINHYREIFGESFDAGKLHDVDDLLERQKLETSAYEAGARYFQNLYSAWRPLELVPPDNTDPSETANRLKRYRETILDARESAAASLKELDGLRDACLDCALASRYLQAGFKLGKKDFSRPMTNLDQIVEHRRADQQKLLELDRVLKPVEQAVTQRLSLALALLPGNHEEDAKVKKECSSLIDQYNRLSSHEEELQSTMECMSFLGSLLHQVSSSGANDQLVQAARNTMAELNGKIKRIRDAMDDLKYPFQHADESISIGKFLVQELPDPEQPGALLGTANSIFHDLHRLKYRIFGRLCFHAERMEEQLGLAPLAEPPIESSEEEKAG